MTINITTSTVSDPEWFNATKHLYGSFGMPQIKLPLNKTSIAQNGSLPTGTLVESNRQFSIEAAHYTNLSNTSSDAFLREVPGLSRTLSGISLGPSNTSHTLQADNSTPHLTYDLYSFTTAEAANLTLYFAPGLNTDPSRPVKYAAGLTTYSVLNSSSLTSNVQVVQPVPSTQLGTLPNIWSGMVSNAVLTSNTTWNLTHTGYHRLNIWLLEPGLVLQKVVLDLGGVVQSYLGPPESFRVGINAR